MRTVIDTANKMTALTSKLSRKSAMPLPGGTAEPVEISSLIDDIVAPIRGDEAVRLHVTNGLVPPVMAVRDQIHQVLLNVVLNAKQAIGQKGEISITTGRFNGSVVITVDDTGTGISPAMFETLFRPLQSSRPGGLGIGLYQCKQIVEAHRGTIQIRSNQGKGTQVQIELPLFRPSDYHEHDAVAHSTLRS